MRFQIVGYTIGILLLILGTLMLVPALLDFNDDHRNAAVFLCCGLISSFFGGILYLSCRETAGSVNLRQAFLFTTLSWFIISLFAAVPLCLADIRISFTDAFFETVSGITTTGSTVLSGLDHMSRGILIWRAIIQWVGGIGIVAFAIIFLPYLRVGGMQLFQTESSDRSEKIMPRTSKVVTSVISIYCILTLVCAAIYYELGMSFFDAVAHAMMTLPTAGFSTHDASFAYFDSYPIEMTATAFMIMGALPFVLYVRLFYRGDFAFHRDAQVRWFLALFTAITLIVSLWMWQNSDYGLVASFRYAAFNIASILTTTGFVSADYTQWGAFPVTIFFFITYIGGCAGSTGGGIKMVRLLIAAAAVKREIGILIFPHGVWDLTYERKSVASPVVKSVFAFLGLYVIMNIVLTLALTLTGLDFVTAMSGAASAIANVGPGLGDIIGPAGNFKSLPDAAKWLLCFGMMLGRLEIMTMLVIFTPGFWRK